MVGRELAFTLGSCSIVFLSIGICYIYKTINIGSTPNISIPISPVKITDTTSNNDDWWPFIEYTKFDTEDNMYNIWTKPRNN